MKYTYKEVFNATNDYFYGNDLSTRVFVDKYALQDNNGNYVELTPNDMHDRLATEFANIDVKYGQDFDKRFKIYREAIDKFARIVPQGSPMCAIGNPYQIISASNCVVIASPEDSISSIIDSGKELAQLFKRRCGAGTDISSLRPEGMVVNNAAKTTTGAWSFADFYSYITRLIGQNSRRGALMVTLSVHHPDVLKFITMKHDLTKVTGANISLRLSDEFLKAVEKDEEYELRWPVDAEKPKLSKMISAKEVWNTIVDSATKTAEPGVIMWDTVTNNLPAHCYEEFKTVSVNPCCFAKDSDVFVVTNNGIKEIKDISSKDLVWVDDKKVWAKTSGYFNAGKSETFKVKLSNNEEFTITANHKLLNLSNSEKEIKELIPLKLLKHGDKICLHQNNPEGIKLKTNNEYTVIESIEPAGVRDVGCIEVEKYHSFTANGVISGNSEISLSSYDSCRLISINLTGYVRNAFKNNAFFDLEAFKADVAIAQQMADNLVDIELNLIDKIKSICDRNISETIEFASEVQELDFRQMLFRLCGDKDIADQYLELLMFPNKGTELDLWDKLYNSGKLGRRTGLGTHGLGDCLAQLCIKYDSDEALNAVNEIYKALRDQAYSTSVDLAKKRGPFPIYDFEKEKDCLFIKRLPQNIIDEMEKYGRRNISLLTQAPTGSVSIVSKVGKFDRFNVSSGIESVFRNLYTRRKKINPNDKNVRVDYIDENGDSWQEFTVFHSNISNYMDVHGHTEDLPDYFITSDEIDWKKRVDIQGLGQVYIDHSISSTINFPKNTPSEVISEVYLSAWHKGLKGVTVYVDGSRDGVLITNEQDVDKDGRPTKIIHNNSPKRPKVLLAEIHNAVVLGVKWTVIIGLLNNEPYELFMGKSDKFKIPLKYKEGKVIKIESCNYNLLDATNNVLVNNIIKTADNNDGAWTTRMMSMSLRHGIPIEYLVDQLSKDGSVVDVNMVLSRLLRKYIKKKEKDRESCPQCGSNEIIYEDGCKKCGDCSWTGCC